MEKEPHCSRFILGETVSEIECFLKRATTNVGGTPSRSFAWRRPSAFRFMDIPLRTPLSSSLLFSFSLSSSSSFSATSHSPPPPPPPPPSQFFLFTDIWCNRSIGLRFASRRFFNADRAEFSSSLFFFHSTLSSPSFRLPSRSSESSCNPLIKYPTASRSFFFIRWYTVFPAFIWLFDLTSLELSYPSHKKTDFEYDSASGFTWLPPGSLSFVAFTQTLPLRSDLPSLQRLILLLERIIDTRVGPTDGTVFLPTLISLYRRPVDWPHGLAAAGNKDGPLGRRQWRGKWINHVSATTATRTDQSSGGKKKKRNERNDHDEEQEQEREQETRRKRSDGSNRNSMEHARSIRKGTKKNRRGQRISTVLIGYRQCEGGGVDLGRLGDFILLSFSSTKTKKKGKKRKEEGLEGGIRTLPDPIAGIRR